MAPDLRPCCQQALLDHWAVCSARPTLSALCRCKHVEVLHGIRDNGTRGACSISTGVKAEPCGCKAFAAAKPASALFDLEPTKPEEGPLL